MTQSRRLLASHIWSQLLGNWDSPLGRLERLPIASLVSSLPDTTTFSLRDGVLWLPTVPAIHGRATLGLIVGQ